MNHFREATGFAPYSSGRLASATPVGAKRQIPADPNLREGMAPVSIRIYVRSILQPPQHFAGK
jgi:hypothetical protein